MQNWHQRKELSVCCVRVLYVLCVALFSAAIEVEGMGREGWGFIIKVNLSLQSYISVGYTHMY